MDGRYYEETKSWVLGMIHAESGNKITKSLRIFKVPPKLLHVRKSAFLPEIFSFGPIYHKEYEKYRDLKRRHVSRLFVGDINGSTTVEDADSPSRDVDPLDAVVEDMIDFVVKANKCYDESSRCERMDPDFFKMMVIDGCFIIELLRLHNKFMIADEEKQLDECGDTSDSPIFAAQWLLPIALRDLIKLANQLPFFFLEKLFLMPTSGNDKPSLQDLFATFFSSMLSLNESIYRLDPNPTRNYAHPLDVCRSLFIFPIQQRRHIKVHYKKNPKLMYSVQELQETGVTIIKKEDSTLLDISFDKGVLKIPPLSIDENTTIFLLNFAIYEQCDQSQRPYFTNYLLFLDCLINTIKDVEILRKNWIIRYPTGTEKELVDLFHNFCKEMSYSFNQNYFLLDMNAVNKYCKAYYDSKWRIWWSDLKKERFSSPWTFLSLVAAIILLVLTMLQALYMMIPYYHPIKG